MRSVHKAVFKVHGFEIKQNKTERERERGGGGEEVVRSYTFYQSS